MQVPRFGAAAASYADMRLGAHQRDAQAPRGVSSPGAETQLTLSDQAKALAASDSKGIEDRLAAIKTKPATQRTDDDTDFLIKHDQRLAQIHAKGPGSASADDLDYVQKAGGLVNTMANLSPKEKALYDELVAQGHTEAVQGMNLLALSRMGGGEVTLGNGRVFDPQQTEITPENVRQLFSQMFVGSDGQDARSFEALASYLDGRRSADSAPA